MTGEDTPESTLRRRPILAGAGSVALTALAGCSSTESDEEPTRAPNEVVVGPNSKYVYDPESITVEVGDTVTWTWASNNHNVVVDEQPADADWPGTDGGTSKTYDEGYEYEYTFDTTGTYTYYCSPHEGMGMTGEVVVEA